MRIIVNNVKCDVIVGGKDNLLPFDIIPQMRKYLSVPVKGAYFSKAYKERKWDGLQYFCTPKGTFATGFLPLVYSFLVDMGVTVHIEDQRENLPIFKDEFTSQIGEWDLQEYKGGYQAEAVQKANNYLQLGNTELYFPRGIYDAATNAGKNSIIAGIHNNMQQPKTLMLLHNKLIFNQAVKFFNTMFDVGIINAEMYDPRDFTIAMYKSLYNKAKASVNVKKDLQQFNTLIVDESHRGGGDEYAKLLTIIKAGARYFVSGTPLASDDKGKNLKVVGLAGPTLYKITNEQLIDRGVSAKPIIKMFRNHSDNIPRLTFSEEVEDRVKFSQEKAIIIGKYCLENKNKQVLISVEHLDQGEYLLEELQVLGLNVEFTHGQDPDQEYKIEQFKECETRILIATMILKEGINIPCINTLVLAHGGKSKITIKQLIGRVVRMDGISDTVDVIDFYDEGKWVAKHSRDRIRIYKKEKFEIEYQYKANGYGFPIR